MGKRLTSSVTFSDSETGENRTVSPNDKLSSEDQAAIEKNWGKRAGEILVDDGEPEEMSAQEALDTGHPMADTALPAQDDPAPGVQSSVEVMQEAREGDAKAEEEGSGSSVGQGAARADNDQGAAAPRARRNVGG